jgi:hypothetical protein
MMNLGALAASLGHEASVGPEFSRAGFSSINGLSLFRKASEGLNLV